jgi:hypothetical protein
VLENAQQEVWQDRYTGSGDWTRNMDD